MKIRGHSQVSFKYILFDIKGKGGKSTTSVQLSGLFSESIAHEPFISSRRAHNPLAKLRASASVAGFICTTCSLLFTEYELKYK